MASALSSIANAVKKVTNIANTVKKTADRSKAVSTVKKVSSAVKQVASSPAKTTTSSASTASKPAASSGSTSSPTPAVDNSAAQAALEQALASIAAQTTPQYQAAQLVTVPSSAPTMDEYLKSSFYTSSNIPALQELLSSYNRSDSDIQSEAEAFYKPGFDTQKTAFENQLAELGVSRDRDIQKLNSQFDRTLNSVMAGLNKQGLGRSSMVATRGVETENARNSAISETSYNYLQQQNQINANLQQAQAEYARNVENKANEIREKNRAASINLQAQIAQLQASGYSSYVNYIQNKTNQEIQAKQIAIQNENARLQNEANAIQNKSVEMQNAYLKYLNETLKKNA